MSPAEIVILLTMSAYAVFRQTQRSEVVGARRFKLAIIYGVVGLAVGGIHLTPNAAQVGLLLLSLALSVVVGFARGRLTRLWVGDGRVYSQGTPLTVGLFFGLILAKFALGTVAYLTGVDVDGGFGDVLLMIAAMVAFQAEIVWRRARPLGARTSTSPATTPSRAAA